MAGVAARSSPACFESGGLPEKTRLIEIQMSISSVRAYILTRNGERGQGRAAVNAECFSCPDVENGRRIAPMFALEFWSEDLESQGCLRLVNVVL